MVPFFSFFLVFKLISNTNSICVDFTCDNVYSTSLPLPDVDMGWFHEGDILQLF